MTSQVPSSIPHLDTDFAVAIHEKPASKKRLAPLSVRLTAEQRRQLEADAVGMSLNAYVLGRLFSKRQKSKPPTKHQKAIGRALRRLAHSGIAAYLASQIVAQEEGRLGLSSGEEVELREAYAECYQIRRDLVEALGLKAEHNIDPASTLITTGR